MTSYDEYESEEPRGWSPLAVALIATLVLLLALGGALFGINVANKNEEAAGDSILPAVLPTLTEPSTPTPSVTASATSSPSVTSSPAGADTFALPDLAGQDFQAARTKVRDLKLGWRLVFEGTGTDVTVRETDPKATTMVKRGDTIKILVKGAAPLATVPDLKGQPCADAASRIVDRGLYPTYRTGREGVVTSQTPAATDPQTLRWNDQVQISCG